MSCVWVKFKTKFGYYNFKSGCRIESSDLPIGWDFCPYCGIRLDRSKIV